MVERTWFRHLLTLRPMWQLDDGKQGTVYLHLGPFYWDGEPHGHVNHFGAKLFGRRIGVRDTN